MLIFTDDTLEAPPPALTAGGGTEAPVWSVRIPFGIRERVVRNQVVTPSEGGIVHRRQTNLSHSQYGDKRPEFREWTITWTDLTVKEHVLLRSLWEETHGGAMPFRWNPPDAGLGSSVLARFVGGSLVTRRLTPAMYTATVRIREELA